jgi:hypothetical protein
MEKQKNRMKGKKSLSSFFKSRPHWVANESCMKKQKKKKVGFITKTNIEDRKGDTISF